MLFFFLFFYSGPISVFYQTQRLFKKSGAVSKTGEKRLTKEDTTRRLVTYFSHIRNFYCLQV